MISRAFSVFVFLLIGTTGFAQYRLTGVVTSLSDSSAVQECIVYLDNDSRMATTDNKGRFVFEDVTGGKHKLHFMNPAFRYRSIEIVVSNTDGFVRARLESTEQDLEEVVITDTQTDFGFTRMRAVENFGIYEGKKSEVIIPEQLVANLATNNARQVYSRIAGLNIWENDGAGLQLSIGGRGLDPNRTSNFNVRQNGYDISADALGYPESYYTPPVEAIGKIQIVRGAASLQYGTQFGGLVNFIMKQPPPDKQLELTLRQTVGSFGFYNAFASAAGTIGKLSYYSFAQYKAGKGWRPNSEFDNVNAYANVNYQFSPATSLGIDVTHTSYLAQQPGGLTDAMFEQEPRQSNRSRNWFKINWNLFALHLNQKLTTSSDLNVRVFGLYASRYSLGFRPNRVATVDDNSERDLITGDFQNWGTEVRYLNRYTIGKVESVFLLGGRYYQGYNQSRQGLGSTGADADFNFVNPDQFITYEYEFPNKNGSAFLENIFYLTEKFSVTPGLRFEYIHTTADGYYGTIYRDLAGNIIDITRTEEQRKNGRNFVLAGLGLSYKPTSFIDIYSNLSQNYRSITFSDMRISNPSSVIDPNIQDEKGYSFDLGVRSDQTTAYNYDVSLFYLNYNNRIGEVQFYDENNRTLRRRGNIGQAIIHGLEAYGELEMINVFASGHRHWSTTFFTNVAYIRSEYTKSETTGVVGNEVEFIPDVNLKTGVRFGYKNLKASFQYTYLSEQFTEATNARDGGVSAVVGIIPSYSIMDLSLSYAYKKFRLETSLNNLANTMYFTRRATGYPGPGILPSDGRSVYVTLQAKL